MTKKELIEALEPYDDDLEIQLLIYAQGENKKLTESDIEEDDGILYIHC